MSSTPGFVELRSTYIAQGPWSQHLRDVDAGWWDGLHENQQEEVGESHGNVGWDAEQWWCLIEMSDAGMDLEGWLRERKAKHVTVLEAWDIFWGVVEALARGEGEAFEHRDLHAGNICVRHRDKQKDQAQEMPEQEEEEGMVRRYTDLEVTLIDYTLSRAEVVLSNQIDGEEEIEVLANSMADPELYRQHSKIPADESQFNTYRLMRDVARQHAQDLYLPRRSPLPWQEFMPKTNMLWLHHILSILLAATGLVDDWGKKGTFDIRATWLGREKRALLERLHSIWEEMRPPKWRDWNSKCVGEILVRELEGENELLGRVYR